MKSPSVTRRALLGTLATVAVARPSAQASASSLLQSAIDQLRGRGGVLRCAPGVTYLCDQPIVFDDVAQVTVEGNRSCWYYTGAGPAFVSARGALQVSWHDLRLHAAPGFAGYLVDTDWSGTRRDPSHLRWTDCEFVGGGSARACLRLNRAIFSSVDHCQFTGAHWGILGVDGAYSNVTTIGGASAFYSLNQAGIYNAGESWTISGNGFEPLTNGTACAYTQDLALYVKGFSYHGNWHGDITQPGGCWVTVRGGGLSFGTNYWGEPQGPCVRFVGVQGAVMHTSHNQAHHLIDFAGGYSRNVTLIGNDQGIGAVTRREYCIGFRSINNFGPVDV